MFADNGKPCPRCGATLYYYIEVSSRNKWRADCIRCGLKHYFRYTPSKRDKWGIADYSPEEIAQAHRTAAICA